jgi:hypothetical protein
MATTADAAKTARWLAVSEFHCLRITGKARTWTRPKLAAAHGGRSLYAAQIDRKALSP